MLTPPRSAKRRRTTGRSSGFTVRNVVNAAVQTAMSHMAGRTSTGTQTRTKKSIDAGGITAQYDRKNLYRKKRMPRRKKKAWKKFKSKVTAVEISNRGLTSRVFNSEMSVLVQPASQDYIAVHLYGVAGTAGANELGENDLATVFEYDDNLRRTGTTAPNIMTHGNASQLTDSIRMQSAILDITMINPSDKLLIVDCYHLWYSQESVYANLTSVLSGGVATTQQVTAAGANVGSAPNLTLFGTSLFDLSRALSLGCIKVMGVKQYLLGAKQVVTDQIRDSKNYTINPYYLRNVGVFAKPKYTETLLFVARNPDEETSASLQIFATRHYRYSIEGITQDIANYQTV